MRGRTREAKGKESVRTPGMLARAGKTVARGLAVLGTLGIMGCAVAQRAPLLERRNLNVVSDSRQGDDMQQVMKKGKILAQVDSNTFTSLTGMLGGTYNFGAGGKLSEITNYRGTRVGTIRRVGASYEIRATDLIFRRRVESLIIAKPVATVDSNTFTSLTGMLGGTYNFGAGGKLSEITNYRGTRVGTIRRVGASYEIRAVDATFNKRLQAELQKIRRRKSIPRRRR